MAKFCDPQGTPLKTVLLQVTSKDELGPVNLRLRKDDETIDLTDSQMADRSATPEFLIVYAPEASGLNQVHLGDMWEDLQKMKRLNKERQAEKGELDRLAGNLETQIHGLEAEVKAKTEELRALQRERDPERFAKAVTDAVASKTAELEAVVKTLRASAVEREREITELKASKKKLREALERAKDKA